MKICLGSTLHGCESAVSSKMHHIHVRYIILAQSLSQPSSSNAYLSYNTWLRGKARGSRDGWPSAVSGVKCPRSRHIYLHTMKVNVADFAHASAMHAMSSSFFLNCFWRKHPTCFNHAWPWYFFFSSLNKLYEFTTAISSKWNQIVFRYAFVFLRIF